MLLACSSMASKNVLMSSMYADTKAGTLEGLALWTLNQSRMSLAKNRLADISGESLAAAMNMFDELVPLFLFLLMQLS